MKTQLIGLLFLGMASLCYSQSNDSDVREIVLEKVIITPLNSTYLNKVQDANTPTNVKGLEDIAARYDITESDVYDKKFESYEVIFKESGGNNGKIVATYNSDGKIISSIEKYKDVKLPYEVSKAVAAHYPGWKIISDTYLVTYYDTKDFAKKSYKVQISKNNTKKNLRIDPNGLVK